MISILCVLQIVLRMSRFSAEMPSMLRCRIRMAGPMKERHGVLLGGLDQCQDPFPNLASGSDL